MSASEPFQRQSAATRRSFDRYKLPDKMPILVFLVGLNGGCKGQNHAKHPAGSNGQKAHSKQRMAALYPNRASKKCKTLDDQIKALHFWFVGYVAALLFDEVKFCQINARCCEDDF